MSAIFLLARQSPTAGHKALYVTLGKRTRVVANPLPAGPLSPGLRSRLQSDVDFYQSLKLANRERFVFLDFIIISRLPQDAPYPEDQVLGFWYFDRVSQVFKQDFVVNVGSKDNQFVSYSRKNNNGPFIRPIKEFFEKYGDGQRYYHRDHNNPNKIWEHHYRDEEGDENVPDIGNLRELARKAQQDNPPTSKRTH